MRLLRVFGVISLILGIAGSASAQRAAARTVDGLIEAPVFFELHSEAYSDPVNLDLFREGKIRLAPLGIHRIENFDWRTHERTDQSWWIRMERFDYMCPILDSRSDLDRVLAKSWIQGWLLLFEQRDAAILPIIIGTQRHSAGEIFHS